MLTLLCKKHIYKLHAASLGQIGGAGQSYESRKSAEGKTSESENLHCTGRSGERIGTTDWNHRKRDKKKKKGRETRWWGTGARASTCLTFFLPSK